MQESAAAAGLTHEGMPAACTSQKKGFAGQEPRDQPQVQRLGAMTAEPSVSQPSPSAACADPASAARKDGSGGQSRPNLKSRQRLDSHTTIASASMMSPAVQDISIASPPVKRGRRLASFLPIMGVSAVGAASSPVAAENKPMTIKQQKGVPTNTTACQSMFSFL